MNKKLKSGFSLLELLIVVALVGIVASMAVPSFMSSVERNRLKAAAEAVKSDAQFARTQAIKQSKDVTMTGTLGNDGNWCYGVGVSVDVDGDGDVDINDRCDCAQTDDTQIDYCDIKRVFGAGFEQTNLASATNNFYFDHRRGTLKSISQNVCFTTANYALKVIVIPSGKVEICTGHATGVVPGYQVCAANC